MSLTEPQMQDEIVFVSRRFEAPRERVFSAWTDPRALQRWFGPQGARTVNAEVDLRVGGHYRFTMQTGEQGTVCVHGSYREIVFPDKLVFTWVLDDQGCEGSEGIKAETLVTIEFVDVGGATQVRLTHEGLPTEKSRQGHAAGWESSLDCLWEYMQE